jgi:hypothetical protein
LDFIHAYLLPIPLSLGGVFRSIVNHIKSRKEKVRPKQLQGIPFLPPAHAG